jgi:protein tyrosine kinase
MFEPVQLGRYDCYERVGTTAYGEVLRARVAGAAVEKHFLVRRLAGAVADDVSARRRFVLAATALMPIEDSRLVGVIEARDVPGGDCFVAMEDVPGVTLERLLPVSADAAAFVVDEVRQALAVLAARKRAHGAVSASNVLITPEGGVKLGDAGLQAALKGEIVTPEVDAKALETLGKLLGASGDAQKGKGELLARVQKALAPPTESQLQPKVAVAAQPVALQGAARVEVPASTGRVVKVPPRPLWMKIAPVVALAVIGVAAWKLLPERKQQVANAAAPAVTPAPAPKKTPPPPSAPAPVPAQPPAAVPAPPKAEVTPPTTVPAAAPSPPVLAEQETDPSPLLAPSRHGGREIGLRVRCHTKGLRILVDGKETGVRCPADYRKIKASEGQHTVAIVRASGGAPISQHTVHVKPQNQGTKVYFKD